MDKIYVEDLEVYAYHGVLKEEKAIGQKFLISLELSLDLKKAGTFDDLNSTVNYAELCWSIEEEFKREKYDLIERAAEQLANFILNKYEIVEGVKVCLKKPWAPIGKPVKYAAVEVSRRWHKAYIALGSNMGDKKANLDNAITKIDSTLKTKVLKVSNYYETSPVGYLEQDDFLNAAIMVKTLLEPKELIELLLSIELNLKRERTIKWGPRTIDLDVLLYDDLITCDEDIIIPHPRMHERAFVLKPLNDIAPYIIHPLKNERICSLLNGLSKENN